MRKWKAPNRPTHEISQAYNDGIVTIYALSDEALPGYRPVPKKDPIATLRYAERKLGIQRYFQGKQNQIQIERVIRVQKPSVKVNNQNIAITEDGEKYRIDLVQAVEDVFPASLDLTLSKFTQGVEG